MAKYWRNYKSEMIKEVKKGLKSANIEEVARNTKPANVHNLELWIKFIKYSLSPTQVTRRKRFQELREAQDAQWHGSKKSSACIAYDMIEASRNPENPDEMLREVTRTDDWIAGFSKKRKDGDEEVEDQEVVRKVKEKMAQQPDSSQWTIHNDPVTQVLGPERRGRVRGYGFGATPSLLIGTGHTDSRIIMLEKEVQDLKMLVKDLISQCDKGDNSSGNNNAVIPPLHVVNCNKDKPLYQKRKNVPCTSTSANQVQKKAPQTQKVHLLSWFETGKIVAIGELASKDPNDNVHCIPLGPHCWKVWVRDVIDDITLSRPTQEFNTLSDAKGSTVAWPSNCIRFF